MRADPPERGIRPQPAARAHRARGVGAVAREQHTNVHLVGLALEPLEEALHAVPDARPALLPALPAGAASDDPLLPRFRGQVAERHVERNAVLRRGLLEIALAFDEGLGLERLDCTFAQRLALVRNHEAVVDTDDAAEAAAGFAGAKRRVERKGRRMWRVVMDVAVGAVQVGRVAPRRNGTRVFALCMHVDAPAAEPQRALDRIGQARALSAREAKAVRHDIEDLGVRLHPFGVHLGIALRFEVRAHLVLTEILGHPHRKGDRQARIAGDGRAGRQARDDRLGGVASYRLRALPAVELGRACEQQLQVIVQLGHRADRAARGTHRIGLVDRDCRRHTFDPVHRGPVHAVEELPCIGRERLDVTALALRVERVEHQRALARARDAGHDDQFAGRDVEIEVGEVVLARTANADRAPRASGHGLGIVGHGRGWAQEGKRRCGLMLLGTNRAPLVLRADA